MGGWALAKLVPNFFRQYGHPGISWSLNRKALVRIAVTSNTRRLLIETIFYLQEFFTFMGDPCSYEVSNDRRASRQFVRALPISGWRHLWDLVIQKTLNTILWFPGWVIGLKVISARAWFEISSIEPTLFLLISNVPLDRFL